MENLANLDRIAKENGGNRAFGLPGFDASRDFVFDRVSKSQTFIATKQDFPANYSKVESITFSVDNTSIFIIGLTYSPSTPPEGLTKQLVLGPTGDVGCSVEGYAGFDVQDKMVLVQRGTCPTGGTLAGRIRPAAAAGAAAVIVYNNDPANVTGGTLSAPDPDSFVPSGFINLADGEALRDRLLAGDSITPYFQQTQLVEVRVTQNVFAESTHGDPNNVILLGAHLDSVKAGAGINDDGSGSSLLLELFDGLQQFTFRNKIRFAWWGAEESGLVGSRYYTAQINGTQDADDLLLYLNFDMVSRGFFGVFDGDGSTYGLAGAPGSDVIETLFVDHLESQGLNVTAVAFSGGSDYAPFMSTLNKPVGGLFTGTGADQDSCYHRACDDYDNANPNTLTINAKAAAHVLSELAQRGQDIIPKSVGNATMVLKKSLDSLDLDEFPWTILEDEQHLDTCGHDV